MTAPTTTRSAYPANVDALLPKARDLAEQLGKLPSRNHLMKEFRIGSPKATAVREALTAAFASTATPAAPPAVEPTPVPVVAVDVDDQGDADHRQTAEATPDVEVPMTVTDQAAEAAPTVKPARRPVAWPVLLLALPAFVAIWAGWVELGQMTGFGKVNLLPGIGNGWVIDTAITLPIGVETYAAYALWVWLSGHAGTQARTFAKWSAIGSLAVGALGQIAYHLMAAAGWDSAPWQITAAVACLPVAVLGMGAALAHLLHQTEQ
jgi:hypothetical protein